MDSARGDDPEEIALDLPPEVGACVDAVRVLGEPVYAVGGVVRDVLLGLRVDDWDFATATRPEHVIGALEPFGEPDVLARLGRVAVQVAGFDVVFTTFREEADYGADRRPATVRFVESPGRDALRRDFTTNALYVDVHSRELTDPTGGLPDVVSRRLRVIGDPRARLAEDPLRILRAVRFEASRGLRPTARTAAAMAEMAPRCAGLTPERRFGELHRALLEPGVGGALLRLLDLGALGYVVPALVGHETRVRTEAVPLAAQLGSRGEAEGWAALLGSVAVAETALAELHAPRALRRTVLELLALADAVDGWSRVVSPGHRRRLAAASTRAVAFAVARLRLRGHPDRADALIEAVRAPMGAFAALPTGRDVIALGIPPGPAVGRILDAVRRTVEGQEISDADSIRGVLEREVARRVKPPGDGVR